MASEEKANPTVVSHPPLCVSKDDYINGTWRNKMSGDNSLNANVKQECIPVGCVPPARNRTLSMGRVSVRGVCQGGRSLSRGVSVRETPLSTDRHLWKHNLRNLRLRAVKTFPTTRNKSNRCNKYTVFVVGALWCFITVFTGFPFMIF